MCSLTERAPHKIRRHPIVCRSGEGGGEEEGGREGGRDEEGGLSFIQRKSSEVKQKGGFLLTSKNKD
jgi:hypothetical protein